MKEQGADGDEFSKADMGETGGGVLDGERVRGGAAGGGEGERWCGRRVSG